MRTKALQKDVVSVNTVSILEALVAAAFVGLNREVCYGSRKFGKYESTMKASFSKLALASGLLILGGCIMGTQYTPPTQQQLAATGYGAPLTIDYKKAIQTLFLDQLKDPLSAQYIL